MTIVDEKMRASFIVMYCSDVWLACASNCVVVRWSYLSESENTCPNFHDICGSSIPRSVPEWNLGTSSKILLGK